MKCIEKNFKYYFIKPIVEGLICTIAVCAGYGQLFPVMKIIAIFLSSLGILFPISFVEFHLKTRRSEWDHPLLFWYCIEKSFKFDSEWLVQGNSLHQAPLHSYCAKGLVLLGDANEVIGQIVLVRTSFRPRYAHFAPFVLLPKNVTSSSVLRRKKEELRKNWGRTEGKGTAQQAGGKRRTTACGS